MSPSYKNVYGSLIYNIIQAIKDCLLFSCLQRLCQILYMGVMFTEIVSNIIDVCHAYRDGVKYYSLVSCLQRWCQHLQLGIISTEIVSNIIAWCHVYKECVKYL